MARLEGVFAMKLRKMAAVLALALVFAAVSGGAAFGAPSADRVTGEVVLYDNWRCSDGSRIIWGRLLARVNVLEASSVSPEGGTLEFGVVCPDCPVGMWHPTTSYTAYDVVIEDGTAMFALADAPGMTVTIIDGRKTGFRSDQMWCRDFRYPLIGGNLSVHER